MTSQIRSHIEYLVQNYDILVLILYSKLMRNVCSRTGGFYFDLMMIFDSGLLVWATLYIVTHRTYWSRWQNAWAGL